MLLRVCIFVLACAAATCAPQGPCQPYDFSEAFNRSKCVAHNCSLYPDDLWSTMCYNNATGFPCGESPYPVSVCHRDTQSCAFGSHQALCCDLSETKPCGMDELKAKGWDYVQDGACIPKDSTCCGNFGGMMPNMAFGCKKGTSCCAGGYQSICCDDATEACVPFAPAVWDPDAYSPKCVKMYDPQGPCQPYDFSEAFNRSKCIAHNCSVWGNTCYNNATDFYCGTTPHNVSVCHRGTQSCAYGYHQALCCDLSETKPCGYLEANVSSSNLQYAACIPKDSTCCTNPNYGPNFGQAFGCKKGTSCCAGGGQSMCCDDATEVCVPTVPEDPYNKTCIKKSVVV